MAHPQDSNTPATAVTAAYPVVGAFVLVVLALQAALGSGPGSVRNLASLPVLAGAFLWSWPLLAYALGRGLRRSWARDLGAAAALASQIRALAAFPRYPLLALAYRTDHPNAAPIWGVLKHSLFDATVFALLCAGCLLALSRPETRKACESAPGQPNWTRGLPLSALLLLAAQIETANRALIALGNRFSLEGILWAGFAVALTVGLWKRSRIAHWAAAVEGLWILADAWRLGLERALSAERGAGLPSLWHGAEAFSRGLPELALAAAFLVVWFPARNAFKN